MTDPAQHARIREVFLAVYELEPGERERRLGAACQGDDALRREVEALLVSHDAGDPLLDLPARVPRDAAEAHPSFPGYNVVREVHHGGQGVVYEAVRTDDGERVAIKTLLHGAFAVQNERARFEREALVLGQLDHPNIVPVQATGSIDGCPYHVMEFVEGEPIDRHLEPGRTPVRVVLELFERIASAVNAAHLRGVLHRDLKPSNILVDARGEPRILDFGLAKAAAGTSLGADDELSTMTMTGQFIGSLPWASPEQAAGRTHEIDVRTDVYSLGVSLYQMLTGRFPYDVSGPLRDVLGRILYEEPAHPSSVRRDVDDEVDTIVARCLQKAPERRYQNAGELARDVGRYLAGQPIEAKRDSGWYVLRKMLVRHRLGVAVTVLLLLTWTGAGIGLFVAFQRARHQAEVAELASAQARKDAAIAETTARVLSSIVDALDPAALATFSIAELDRVAEVVRSEFGPHPDLEARLSYALNIGYRGTMGGFDPETSLARSIDQVRAALALQESTLGPGHPDTLRSLTALAGLLTGWNPVEAQEVAVELLERTRNGADGSIHSARATALAAAGDVYSRVGRPEEGERCFEESMSLARELYGLDDSRTWIIRGLLALSCCNHGRHADAERRGLEWYREATERGAPDAVLATSLRMLRSIYVSWGQPERLAEFDAKHLDFLAGVRRAAPAVDTRRAP